MMLNLETRAFPECELRIAGDDDSPRITGFAAVFDQWSPDYGGFREIVRPGAFTDTLAAPESDVRGLFNHDPNLVLGRQTANTMTLKEEKNGLRFDILADETRISQDLIVKIRRGDVSGASFSFTVRDNGDAWEFDGKGNAERELRAVDLYDVGPVTFPFYTQTKVAARSLELFRRANPRDWGRSVRSARVRRRRRIVVPGFDQS